MSRAQLVGISAFVGVVCVVVSTVHIVILVRFSETTTMRRWMLFGLIDLSLLFAWVFTLFVSRRERQAPPS